MQAMLFNISFQFFISAIALLEVTNNKPVSHMSMFFVLRCYLYSFAYGDKPFFFPGTEESRHVSVLCKSKTGIFALSHEFCV